MKRIGVVALALLALAAAVQQSSAYQIVQGHPRLFFLSSELPALRAKCTGPLAEDYNDIKSWCDSNMNASLPLPSIDYYEDYLATYGFVYLMSQNPAYAARAKAIAQYALGQGFSGQSPYTKGMALFYDWCYPYLTSAERQTFGSVV